MPAAPVIRLKLIAVDATMLGATPAVVAIAVGGAKYQLRHQFADLAAAERVADRVAQKRTIDPSLWDLVGVTANSRAAAVLKAEAAADAARVEAARAERRIAA